MPVRHNDREDSDYSYMRQSNNGDWKVDKHIPVALLLAIFLQTVAAVWWAATITSRVGVIEALVASDGKVAARMDVVEAKLDGIQSQLRELWNEHGHTH